MKFVEPGSWSSQGELGQSCRILKEGLNGRTPVWDDPFGEHRNGKTYLHPFLESHRELDLVVLMLGTNDPKAYFKMTPCDVAQGLKVLCTIIKNSGAGRGGGAPELLLVSPPPFGKLTWLKEIYAGTTAKSKLLSANIRNVSTLLNCHYFDAGRIVKSSEIDGVHWDADQHLLFGQSIAAEVISILSIK